MADVTITITSEKGSRVKVVHGPNKGDLRATYGTSWTREEWIGMLIDQAQAEAAAKTLGVTVYDILDGIRSMQEQTRNYGPVVYRAWCGREVYDREDGVKRATIPELTMGWDGDERAEKPEYQVDKYVPEGCLACPKLKHRSYNFLVRDGYEGGKAGPLYPQVFHVCRTFTLVPGAVPPPHQPKDEAVGAR